MDLNFFNLICPFLLKGTKVTIVLMLLALTFGTFIGLISAFMRLSKVKILVCISWFYTWIIRGTPLLVQLFIWYYGLPNIGIKLNAFIAGVCALSLCEGAYISEIFRAGILSVDRGQKEAALSLGMTSSQSMKHIVLPQAIKIILPPFANECITSMKDTALVSTITLAELMRQAQILDATHFRSMEIYLSVGLIYLLMTSVIMLGIYILEKKFQLKVQRIKR